MELSWCFTCTGGWSLSPCSWFSFRRSTHQWNKLLETCCVKYEIFVWCNKSIYFNGITHTTKQETYVSWNLLIVLHEEMLRNFRRRFYVFHWFKWKEYKKLIEICFPNVHWAANLLHDIFLWNMFYVICFIGVCHALGSFFHTSILLFRHKIKKLMPAIFSKL